MKKGFLTLVLVLVLVLATFGVYAQTNYYINAVSGNDENNDGTSADKAWKTINGHADTWRLANCIVNIADGEYVITSKIELTANVQITGTGKDKVFLIGATDEDFEEDRYGNKPYTNSGFFDVNSNVTVTVKNLTLKNIRLGAEGNSTPYWGGFISVQSGNTLVMNSVDILKGELPVGGGAGIDCKGTLNLTNVTFADCIADRQGAAVSLNEDCIASFSGCTFKNNTGTTTIQVYPREVASGVCADLNFDNCFFLNNDYSASQYGSCIQVGNFYGKKLNYHITNSTFSGNTGHSAGALFITTDNDKTREIDFSVINSTFINNTMTIGPHGALYSMNLGPSNTISGSISFVNNTFYHNGRTPGGAGSASAIYFGDNSVNFNFINNINLSENGKGEDVVLFEASQEDHRCTPTIKGNIFEHVGGGMNTYTNMCWDPTLNIQVGHTEEVEGNEVYINGNEAVKLETTLTFQGDYKAPYLKIQEGSVAIDGGIKDNALIPALDVRGQAIYNDKKDVGAYEYNGSSSGITSVLKGSDIKAYFNRSTGNIVLSEEASSVSVYSIAGILVKSAGNNALIDVTGLPSGLYILKIKAQNGKVSSIKVQK